MYKSRFYSVYRLFMIFIGFISSGLETAKGVLLNSLFIVSLGLAASGCSKYFSKYGSLYDAGILPLSTENPYMATNSFIAQEMQRSSFLTSFIKEKGAPHAIQIKRDGKSLTLYYPRNKTFYSASKVSEGATTRQWLTTGPFKMSRPDFLELRGLKLNLRDEPALFFGDPVKDPVDLISDRPAPKIQPQIVVVQPTATPKVRKKNKLKGQVSSKDGAAKANPTSINPTPLPNADQQAISLSKQFAPRALNGDLIHLVNFEGESLESISSWYTGSLGNLGAISIANNLEPGQRLKRGESILIPVNLVKNLVRKDK